MTGTDTAPNTLAGRRLLLGLAAAIVGAAVVGTATATLAQALAPSWASDLNHLAPVVIAAVYATVIVALLAVLGRTSTQRQHWLGLRPTTPRAAVLGLTAWAAAYLVAAAVYLALTPTGASLPEAIELLAAVGADNGRLHDASTGLTAVILIRILVLSPLAEELLFRGALFTWLRTRIGPTWTILLTGVAFGLIHQAPLFLPLAITVGIAAGWIRERTGSTWVTVIAHSVQSLIVVLASLIGTGWDTPPLLGQ
ncbi:MAG TPA: CPBP family intramembrane glutamic endopeptidase [Micromonosporaceae bacterium]|nr:CPBP family intramembrane glutamic endopeptidase [Micromonosporaceae bacterium]